MCLSKYDHTKPYKASDLEKKSTALGLGGHLGFGIFGNSSILRLRMETSWRQGRDMGAGDKSRARDASRVLRYFFLIIYIFNYTNKFSKALYLRMETLGAAEKGCGN